MLLTYPQQCAATSPSCTCTFCTVNYHCPTCTRKLHVRAKCRLEAEIKAKKEAELRAIAKLEKDREERGVADELAGAMNEFFSALYEDDMLVGYDDLVSGIDNMLTTSIVEPPLASPDSITVTTEFGVVEETGNVIVISASGPSPHHYAFDTVDTDEENNVEMTEDLNDDMPALNHDLSEVYIPPHTPAAPVLAMPDVEVGHNEEGLNDTGEEADVDTDDFEIDAEGAIIEEFMDDDDDDDVGGGLLTPTATATA
jgi:hypothetical protein